MESEILTTLYGPLHVPHWPTDLIIRALQQHGEWGETETDVLAPVLKAGDRLWDVGAYLGTFSLSLAAKAQLGGIVAIEANPVLASYLDDNLRANAARVSSAVLAPCGVGDLGGWLIMDGAGEPNNRGATSWIWAAEYQPNAIRCSSLAELRSEYGGYDVLKLDLEGMEFAALKGDYGYIKERKPVIWAECNETAQSMKLLGMLIWLGYDVVYLGFPAFRRDNFLDCADLIYPFAYEANLLAAPPSRLSKIDPTSFGHDLIFRHVQSSADLRSALYDTPRWCRPEWLSLNRAELVARLGRADQQKSIADFLK